MKAIHFIAIFLLSITINAFAQHIAVSADKMNVLYIGVPNPVSIAAENCPCKQLVVYNSNGKIEGANCVYSVYPKAVGKATISLYKKTGKTLKKLGEADFKVRNIPGPVFKIGPGSKYISKQVIAAQEYVRAELENIDYDARFTVDSFYTTIKSDSAATKTIFNVSNKIGSELHAAFTVLKKDDIIIFDRIFSTGPDGYNRELDRVVVQVIDNTN